MQGTRRIDEIEVPEDRFRQVQTDNPKFRELVKSIKRLGVLRPLGVTKENVLVYGARQLAAAKEARREEVPVVVIPEHFDEIALREMEVAENVNRVDYSPVEMFQIAAYFLKQEQEAADRRKKKALKNGEDAGESFPDEQKGRAKQQIARRIGTSYKTVDKILQLGKEAPDLLDECERLYRLKGTRKVDRFHRQMKFRKRTAELVAAVPEIVPTQAGDPLSEVDRILLGDNMELMSKMPDGCINAVILDPPYGIGLTYGGVKEPVDNDAAAYWRYLKPMVDEAWRLLKPGGLLCLFQASGYEPFFGDWFGKEERDYRLAVFARAHHADRSNGSSGSFNRVWDAMIMRWKPGAEPMTPKTRNRDLFVSDMAFDDLAKQFPCPKPLDLGEWLMERFVPEGALVLVPCSGSGTFEIAAKRTGRRFLGMEVREDYWRLANQRLHLLGRPGVKMGWTFFLGKPRYVPWDFYDDPEVAQIAEEEPVGIVWG
jgi:hypothetical protein